MTDTTVFTLLYLQGPLERLQAPGTSGDENTIPEDKKNGELSSSGRADISQWPVNNPDIQPQNWPDKGTPDR